VAATGVAGRTGPMITESGVRATDLTFWYHFRRS
jgi:hypothetical protein